MHSNLVRRVMVGLAWGLVAWACLAFVPGASPWAPVVGLAVALVLWA